MIEMVNNLNTSPKLTIKNIPSNFFNTKIYQICSITYFYLFHRPIIEDFSTNRFTFSIFRNMYKFIIEVILLTPTIFLTIFKPKHIRKPLDNRLY